MIGSATLRIVLLVSCAHALVHVYELSLPSVEQQIAEDFFSTDVAAGKQFTGTLSNYWRLLWGLGALLAGWLVDRVGSRPMLVIYLVGCGTACVLAGFSQSRTTLFTSMVFMGALAAIYHPAGLALISHHTDEHSRPKALGIHGIFGSLGIGTAPLLAWLLLGIGLTWREYYWFLAVPGLLLGLLFCILGLGEGRSLDPPSHSASPDLAGKGADWRSYFTLTVVAMLQGFIYSGLMSFLPRYLSLPETAAWGQSGQQLGKVLAAGALLLGCVGQYLAGRYARPHLLELQLTLITFGNAPLLAWMAIASGWNRAAAAGLLALVHFMHQPIYNSLIAKYTPGRHRSLCYGFSFAMGLGLGSFGARFAGASQSDFFVYGILALVAAGAGCLALSLVWMNRA